jgi:hypothetical protein
MDRHGGVRGIGRGSEGRAIRRNHGDLSLLGPIRDGDRPRINLSRPSPSAGPGITSSKWSARGFRLSCQTRVKVRLVGLANLTMNKYLNVIHTTSTLKQSWGGPSRTVPSLCESLGAIGVSVHLVTPTWQTQGDPEIFHDSNYVSLHQVRSLYSPTLRFLFSPFFFRTIANLCRHLNIQIIHNHGLWLP